jgi:hypothetical protein
MTYEADDLMDQFERWDDKTRRKNWISKMERKLNAKEARQ